MKFPETNAREASLNSCPKRLKKYYCQLELKCKYFTWFQAQQNKSLMRKGFKNIPSSKMIVSPSWTIMRFSLGYIKHRSIKIKNHILDLNNKRILQKWHWMNQERAYPRIPRRIGNPSLVPLNNASSWALNNLYKTKCRVKWLTSSSIIDQESDISMLKKWDLWWANWRSDLGSVEFEVKSEKESEENDQNSDPRKRRGC